MLKVLLVFILILGCAQAGADAEYQVLSTTVGKVSDQVVTSRDVKINHLIEAAMESKVVKVPLLNLKLAKVFKRETSSVLMEWVVYLESLSFKVKKTSKRELDLALKSIKRKLKRHRGWISLEVQNSELKEIVRRKLQAKAFIRFRVNSSIIPITDEEALKYFEENRLEKFGDVEFSVFKNNIKAYLKKQQMDQRMRDWFDVLRRKYSVSHLSINV